MKSRPGVRPPFKCMPRRQAACLCVSQHVQYMLCGSRAGHRALVEWWAGEHGRGMARTGEQAREQGKKRLPQANSGFTCIQGVDSKYQLS